MKIKISNNNELFIDDTRCQISELTAESLENIVNLSLENKVEYEIDGDSPIGNFFKRIQNNTKEGSEFKEKVDALKKQISEKTELTPNYLKEE